MRVKFEAIFEYHEWYLCQISRTNHATICLYYYPQTVIFPCRYFNVTEIPLLWANQIAEISHVVVKKREI